MHRIPHEIISHIGLFLPYQDRNRCMESAKMFRTVSSLYTYHILNFDGTSRTYEEPLLRLTRTLAHVRKIKHMLRTFDFVFNDIGEDAINTLMAVRRLMEWNTHLKTKFCDVKVNVEINRCHVSTIHHIINMFKYTGWEWNALRFGVYIGALPSDYEDWIYEIDQLDFLARDVDKPCIEKLARVPILCLYCKYITSSLDLSSIDIYTNQKLTVVLSARDIVYLDICKATCLHVLEQSVMFPSFIQCLKQYNMRQRNGQRSRLELICIHDLLKISCDVWSSFVTVLPSDMHYRITVKEPQCMWYLQQLCRRGVPMKNIEFISECKASWLAATMVKKCFSAFDMCKVICTSQACIDQYHHIVNALQTPLDCYGAMDDTQQVLWCGIIMMQKC